MTLQDVKLLHAFNSWANNRIFDALEALPEEELSRDLKSSHASIHGTLTHLVAAEKMWLSRMVGPADKAMVKPQDVPTLSALRKLWEQTGFSMAKFISTLSDRARSQELTMSTSTGQLLSQLYWQALQHVVDHSTYHRGQIVTLLRQLGHTPPSSSMIAFYRETAKRA